MAGYVIASFWAVSLAVAYAVGQKDRRATRNRQRGGHIRPRVSAGRNPETTREQPAPETTGCISSTLGRGGQSVAAATLEQRLSRSRPTALGSSGNATAEAGASGPPHEDADSARPVASWAEYETEELRYWPAHDTDGYCRCGAHVVGTACYFGYGPNGMGATYEA